MNHYQGTFSGDGFVFNFLLHLEINGDRANGYFKWILVSQSESNEHEIGSSGKEFVRGSFQNSTLLLKGYRKSDDNDLLSLDEYNLFVSEDGFHGTTKGLQHNWSCSIWAQKIHLETSPFFCSYDTKSQASLRQSYYQCYTCCYIGDTVVCEHCKENCHKGHEVSESINSTGICNCGVDEHVTRRKCTYEIHGEKMIDQLFVECFTCRLMDTGEELAKGVCLYCADNHHVGHQLSAPTYERCYCDCGLLHNHQQAKEDAPVVSVPSISSSHTEAPNLEDFSHELHEANVKMQHDNITVVKESLTEECAVVFQEHKSIKQPRAEGEPQVDERRSEDIEFCAKTPDVTFNTNCEREQGIISGEQSTDLFCYHILMALALVMAILIANL